MREQVRYQLWIVAAAGTIFLTNLGGAALWDMDEAYYATCAWEMLQSGDWVVPMFNGQMSPIKPPLSYWGMMAGFELFGFDKLELGARFFSAIFGVATALCAFHLGRILCNGRVGLWAGLITASTIIFTVSARAATTDSVLTLLTTLAFLLFVIGKQDAEKALRLPYAILMYACIGAATLAKGPVGMVLPLAAMGLYLLVVDGWRNVFRSAWRMRPCTALLVMAAVALPWHVWVGIRTDGAWLREFLLDANLGTFKQPTFGHGVNPSGFDQLRTTALSVLYGFYHVPWLLVGFFPWSVFLGPTLVETVRRIRRNDAWRDGCLLASCWFATWFVFWSICKTKLPHYLMPAYPALALLTACFVDRWQSLGKTENRSQKSDLSPFPNWGLRNAWISMILVGVGILIVAPMVTAIYLPGEAALGLIGLIPLLGGGWCWWQTAHDRHRPAAVAFAVVAVAFLTAIFGWAASRVDRYQNARPMIAAISADWKQGEEPSDSRKTPGRPSLPEKTALSASSPPIATYRFFRESTVFYAGHPVTRCDDGQQPNRSASQGLREFLANSDRSYVITTDKHALEIDKDFPGQFRELFRQRRFLGPDEMVVLRSERRAEAARSGARRR